MKNQQTLNREEKNHQRIGIGEKVIDFLSGGYPAFACPSVKYLTEKERMQVLYLLSNPY